MDNYPISTKINVYEEQNQHLSAVKNDDMESCKQMDEGGERVIRFGLPMGQPTDAEIQK